MSDDKLHQREWSGSSNLLFKFYGVFIYVTSNVTATSNPSPIHAGVIIYQRHSSLATIINQSECVRSLLGKLLHRISSLSSSSS